MNGEGPSKEEGRGKKKMGDAREDRPQKKKYLLGSMGGPGRLEAAHLPAICHIILPRAPGSRAFCSSKKLKHSPTNRTDIPVRRADACYPERGIGKENTASSIRGESASTVCRGGIFFHRGKDGEGGFRR